MRSNINVLGPNINTHCGVGHVTAQVFVYQFFLPFKFKFM